MATSPNSTIETQIVSKKTSSMFQGSMMRMILKTQVRAFFQCVQSGVSVMKINPRIFNHGVKMLVQNISDPMKYWCSVNSELIP